MQPPNLPDNEDQRLNALRCLNILDTASEERFDRVTRIAKQVFGVPIALVSLVDKDRQWFKSKIGTEAIETSRDVSFCGHAILQDNIMVVEDASLDQRFFDNPLVTQDPNIKFYLGCPLKIKNRYNIGTLCLLDQKPRTITNEQKTIIRDLADLIESEFESIQLATTDELTLLSNRRGFLLMGQYVFDLCKRNQDTMILLYFDLDKFKLINDTYGHSEGDDVLKIFSQALLKCFRNSDVTARLGGDEFCLLCTNLLERDIHDLLLRFQQVLKEENTKPYKIEYSVGFVSYGKDEHRSLNELLAHADSQMYQNKHAPTIK